MFYHTDICWRRDYVWFDLLEYFFFYFWWFLFLWFLVLVLWSALISSVNKWWMCLKKNRKQFSRECAKKKRSLSRACLNARVDVSLNPVRPWIEYFCTCTKSEWNHPILESFEPFKCFMLLSFNTGPVVMHPYTDCTQKICNKRNRCKNTQDWQKKASCPVARNTCVRNERNTHVISEHFLWDCLLFQSVCGNKSCLKIQL